MQIHMYERKRKISFREYCWWWRESKVLHWFCCSMTCFQFLGPSVNKLNYWGSSCEAGVKSNKDRQRILRPLNEFFLLLIRLCLEQDIVYRFDISQSTVSPIIMTWTNLLYHQLKQIPLWPLKALTLSNMPNIFQDRYPFTSVIIDATEFSLNSFLLQNYSS